MGVSAQPERTPVREGGGRGRSNGVAAASTRLRGSGGMKTKKRLCVGLHEIGWFPVNGSGTACTHVRTSFNDV